MKWQNKSKFHRSIVALCLIVVFQLFRQGRLNSEYLYPEDDGLPTQDDNVNNNEYGIGQFQTAEGNEIIYTHNADGNDSSNNDDDDVGNGLEDEKNIIAIDVTNAQTGSFSNCTQRESEPTIEDRHPDSGTLTVSCGTIRYRAPIRSFTAITSPIIVGVLSNAGANGPIRRDTIRNTWAKNQSGVFFLVAGPWEALSNEYEGYGDLIWIDEEEIYNREHSVLQMKTLSFLSILYTLSEKISTLTYSYAFKTDDDSYVDIHALHTTLTNTSNPPDYWGHCAREKHEPNRGVEYKWPISLEDYPNPFWPIYCQGAGYALSRTFVDCAGSGGHIDQLLPVPFEDTAVGMLAERCDVVAINPEGNVNKVIKLHRYDGKEAKRRVSFGESLEDLGPIPPPCMTGKVLQHRIVNEVDMRNHHRTVLYPSFCDVMEEKYAVERKEFTRKRRENYKNAKRKRKADDLDVGDVEKLLSGKANEDINDDDNGDADSNN